MNPFVDSTDPRFVGDSMENPAVRAAVLADVLVRRRLQIITEIPEKKIETRALFGSDNTRLYAPDLLGDVLVADLVGATVTVGPETVTIASYSRGFLTLQTPLINPVNPGMPIQIRVNAQKQGRVLASDPDGVVHQAIWNTGADFFLGVLAQVRITPFDSREGDLSDSVRSGFFLEGTVSVSSRSFNGNGISGIEVADFNGDQIKDIIYSNSVTQEIRVFIQDPNGGFMEDMNSPFLVDDLPNSVVAIDANQDGRMDVAYITDFGCLNVHFQDMDGFLDSTPDLNFPLFDPECPLFRLLKKGDVNNDGMDDLVLLGRPELLDDDDSGFLYVFLQGQGTIAPAPYSPIQLGVNSTFFDIGDLNNDGRNDIAVANFGEFPLSGLTADFPNSEVTIYLQDLQGDIAEAAFSPITVGRAAAGITIGDFNGDNLNDFAVGSSVDSVITVMTQTPQQTFVPDANNPTVAIAGSVSDFMVSGDINGDGADDIMTITRGSENISILIQQNGQLIEPVGAPLNVANNRLGLRSRLKLADLDGDGANELLASSFMTRL
ncbi:MAG: VCBS repeat-containing protein, partial [Planctomycetota bacterium]|nr:VCBS repeat-containing protein [Planctomycetota bacterium]